MTRMMMMIIIIIVVASCATWLRNIKAGMEAKGF